MIRQVLLVPQGARLQETRGGAETRPAQVSRAALAQGWTLLSRKRCDLELASSEKGRDGPASGSQVPAQAGHLEGTAGLLRGFGQCRAKLQQRHRVATGKPGS